MKSLQSLVAVEFQSGATRTSRFSSSALGVSLWSLAIFIGSLFADYKYICHVTVLELENLGIANDIGLTTMRATIMRQIRAEASRASLTLFGIHLFLTQVSLACLFVQLSWLCLSMIGNN